jgi:hypothetical protein
VSEPVDVIPVRTPRDLEQFIDFPHALYTDNPVWIAPLRAVQKYILNVDYNPFWRHADRALFLARRNGSILGTISAQIDHAYNAHWREHCGSFGFFECVDDADVARLLFDAAADWLRARGMCAMRGPMSPSMGSECGFLTNAFDVPPTFAMAYNPPYYLDLAQTCGCTPVRELLAYSKPAALPSPTTGVRIAEQCGSDPQVRIRHLTRRGALQDAAVIAALYNECWTENWGFSPVTVAEVREIITVLRFIGHEETALLAYVNGEAAGFYLALPDVNQVLRGARGRLGPGVLWRWFRRRRYITRARTVMFGLKPRFRRTGLTALLYCTADAFLRTHYREIEYGWLLDSNRAARAMMDYIGAVITKRYVIVERYL